MDDVVRTHYRRLANQYDEFLLYSPEFVRTLTEKMVRLLGLRPGDRLVDLGCGTAMYSRDILRQVALEDPVTGVDPFPEMLKRIPDDAHVTPLCMGALEFSQLPGAYNKVLVKEAVHHIDDRPTLFRNLYRNLPSGGVLLLVHVPPRLEYPIFERALRRCEEWHADPDELTEQLETAGFHVTRDAVDYPHAIPKETCFRMVAGQYMSVLSSFSDEEIHEGLAEMEERYAGRTTLEFNDHFDYLAAAKA